MSIKRDAMYSRHHAWLYILAVEHVVVVSLSRSIVRSRDDALATFFCVNFFSEYDIWFILLC